MCLPSGCPHPERVTRPRLQRRSQSKPAPFSIQTPNWCTDRIPTTGCSAALWACAHLDGVDLSLGKDFFRLREVGESDARQFGGGCARGNSPAHGFGEGLALSEGPCDRGGKRIAGANRTEGFDTRRNDLDGSGGGGRNSAAAAERQNN